MNKETQWTGFSNPNDEKDFFPSDLKYSIKSYLKNEVLFRQGEVCDALNIIMSGSVRTEMITENGSVLGIEIISSPRPLAPAFLFSDNNYFPVEVTAMENVELLRIPKEEVVRLMAIEPRFLQQFLTHNANRTQFLTNRLQLLSIKTIKGKIAHFMLEQVSLQGNPFKINRNQTELAEFFGVARPSLARSISEMEEDGIIEVKKKEYNVLNNRLLRDLLM